MKLPSKIRIPFEKLDLKLAVQSVFDDIATNQGASYLLVNSYSIVLSEYQPEYRAILQNNNRNLIDGRIIQWLLNCRSYRKVKYSQVRGADLTREILRTFPKEYSIFLLGGTIDNLEELNRTIPNYYPNVKIVDYFSPSYEEDWSTYIDDCVVRIAKSRANLILVSLGTPKQDFVSHQLAEKCGLVTVSIGAALDFLTTRIAECPKWLQVIGLEWTFRLFQEPRRLWRRYLIHSPKVIAFFIKGVF